MNFNKTTALALACGLAAVPAGAASFSSSYLFASVTYDGVNGNESDLMVETFDPVPANSIPILETSKTGDGLAFADGVYTLESQFGMADAYSEADTLSDGVAYARADTVIEWGLTNLSATDSLEVFFLWDASLDGVTTIDDPFADFASAFGSLSITVDSFGDIYLDEFDIANGETFSVADGGLFSIMLDPGDFKVLSIEALTDAYADSTPAATPIPLPPAMALMLGGLAALFGASRRSAR